MATVVTRAGFSSPSPKKDDSSNPKGKERKKAIAMKSKVDTVGSQLVKRKQPEIDSQRKKEKAKRVKLSSGKDLSVVEGPKPVRVSSSSVIKVFHHFILCFLLLSIMSFV